MPKGNNDIIYSVIFLGEIITGFKRDQVLNNLSKITRMKQHEAEKKFFNSGNVVIKRTADIGRAKKYQNKFLRAGLAVGIQMECEQAAV